MIVPILCRKRPIQVLALQWTGDNEDAMRSFTKGQFEAPIPAPTEAEGRAQVYDFLHEAWIPLQVGDWVIQGVAGEFYPCNNQVFIDTYEQFSPLAA